MKKRTGARMLGLTMLAAACALGTVIGSQQLADAAVALLSAPPAVDDASMIATATIESR